MKIKKILSLALIASMVVAGGAPEAQAAKKMGKKVSAKYSLASTNVAPTNQSVRIKVNKKKGTKVKEILWKKGKTTKTGKKYWKKGKNITKGKAFSAAGNGWYSVRITDKKNRVTCKTIAVTNIDKYGPAIESIYSVSQKVATISAVIADSPSGVSYVGYAKGYLHEKKNLSVYTAVGGATTPVMIPVSDDMLVATHQFTVDTPGYYTICARDNVGNVSLHHVQVELWKELTSVEIFDYSTASLGRKMAGVYEGTVYDRWENTYTKVVGLGALSYKKTYIEYCLNGAYKNLSGTIVRGKGIEDDDIVWMEIVADDVVVYTSPKMDYKSRPISFEVSLQNARYLEIRTYSEDDNYYSSWDEEQSDGIYIADGKLYN